MSPAKRNDSGTDAPRPEHTHEHAELAALHETAIALIDRLDLESVLQAVVERAGELVGTEHGYLYLRTAGTDELRAQVGTGMFGYLPGYRIRVGQGLAGKVAAAGEPIVVVDYGSWEGSHPELKSIPSRAVVGVPLVCGREVTGVLGLAHREEGRAFGASEIDLLTRFAGLAALALENARLFDAARGELAQRRNTEEELLDTIARLRRSERALRQAHDQTIRRLGFVAEFRNAETGKHVERMSRLCLLLGRRLGLDEDECELLRAASPLHDIGKIAISDEILLKPGPLSPDERAVIERHAEVGYRLLQGSSSELLELAATIAYTHHERHDGTGYPRGLAREEIPLAGRIAAVADVFDALTSDRPYRSALTVDEAIELMRAGRGTQFDPLVLDTLLQALPEMLAPGETADGALSDLNGKVEPIVRHARERDEARPAPASVEVLDPSLLARAIADAETVLRGDGRGRQAIEDAFSVLVTGLEDNLLVSVYVEEHGRLWLITQRGYREVIDGFSLEHGVMARAVRTQETQFVQDTGSDPDFVEATPGILSELTIPFDSPDDSRFRGAFNIETVGAVLPPESIALAQPLAELFGGRLSEMRDGLDVDVPTLARLCVHASSLRGTSSIAEFAARTIGRLLDLECVQVDLRPEGGTHGLASFWRREATGLEPLSPVDVERLEHAEDRSRVTATFHHFDQRQSGSGSDELAAPWIVWFPLTVAGGTLGAIIGRASSPVEFDHERVEAATLFAQHTAALIDVSLALRREQRAAVTDSLTGLLNRRGFDERLAEELDRASHTGTNVALVLADCDGLKAINDLGGHELGDRVLQAFAQCLRTNKRPEDAAARIGGDEFAILVPGASSADAALVAERLRHELRDLPIASEIPVVATFGVATYPDDGASAADLLRAADRALYAAKRARSDEASAA